MPTTFDKLNLKDHKEILVLNAPDTFEKEIRGLCDAGGFRRIEDMKALAFALSFVTQRAELHRLSRSSRRKLAGDAYCGLRTQKVRRRNIRAISIGTMAGRCCVKRGSIAFAKSQLTMIGLLFASGASSSSSSPSSGHGNHATKWHLVTRLLGLPQSAE